MADSKSDTETLIFEAACRVFQRKGYGGARMQEIADEAEINKSMLHYYYRSKDKLFQEVFQRQMSQLFPVIFGVLGADHPLDEKITRLVEAYYSFLEEHPFLPQFIMIEMNRNPGRIKQFIREKGVQPPEPFFRQVEDEIAKGNLQPVEPRQLLVSIIGLILFPFLGRTMIEGVFGLDEQEYQQFMQARKEFLPDFILNAIDYQKS